MRKTSNNNPIETDEELLNNIDSLSDDLACCIPPSVFICSAKVAADENRLKSTGISLVINCARSLKAQCSDPSNLLLDVTTVTSESECEDFFAKAFSFLSSRTSDANQSQPCRLPRLCIALDDDGTQSVRNVAVPFARFMTQYLGETVGGKVCIHCVQGKSRSASMAAAFLMFGEGQGAPAMMLPDALEIILKHHPIAQPNPTFGVQLFALWKKRFDQTKDNHKKDAHQ